MSTTVTFRAKFAVPNELVWSDSDFDTKEEALSFMEGALYEGHISGYEIWKITTVKTSEKVASGPD